MEYRKLGQSDLVTSVIGFGGFPIGRGHYGPFDDDEAVRSVHRAIDLGVTLFDTAAGYGLGEGEKLLGRALKGRRDRIVLVSKGSTAPDRMAADLEASLQRLQTDYLDLYLIHWPDASVPIADSMGTLADFQQQGKIRYGGVSNFSAAQLGECLETFPIVTEQIGYHLFDRRPEAELFPFCNANGLGVMAFGPMAHGLLTGAMTPETTFGEDDFRSRGTVFEQPLFEGEHFLKYLRRVDALKQAARERGFTVAQLALAWVMANPIVSVALAGTRRPEEIEENVRAVEWRMTADERAEIAAIAATAYTGREGAWPEPRRPAVRGLQSRLKHSSKEARSMTASTSSEPTVSTIELELPGAPPARFKLLWDAAPQTCAAVIAGLPEEAECLHAIYSGTIAAFYFDPTVVAPTENATTCVAPGDLIFTHYEAGTRHGHPGALSEVYWPYDRYARPTIPGQFVTLDAANVFGAYDGPADVWQAFAARCERLRYDGTSTIQIRTF